MENNKELIRYYLDHHVSEMRDKTEEERKKWKMGQELYWKNLTQKTTIKQEF